MKALALLCLLLPLAATAGEASTSTLNVNTFRAPTIMYFDAGTAEHFPLYVAKGSSMSGGTQAVGICFGGYPSADGYSCSSGDGRSGYLTLNSDVQLHTGSGFSGDTLGAALTWRGIVYGTFAGVNGPAFYASGANAYSILGSSTTAGLVASSATTVAGYTFNSDAGVPMFNDGTQWKFFSSGTAQSAVYMNALLAAATTFGGEALGPTNRSYYAVAGRVLTAGTNGGGSTIALTASDGVGTCTAALPCTSGTGTNFNLATTGTCAFAAGASITYATGASGCTVNPTILGNVYFQSN